MKISDIMYTLGQMTRAVYPAGDVPPTTLSMIQVRPASGLALLLNSPDGKAADEDRIGRLMAEIPANLTDPPGGVRIADQGPFWLGYYQYQPDLPPDDNEAITLLRYAGSLLCGDRWQSELARVLDVGDRRVREWIAGERRIPDGVWPELAAALRQRGNEAVDLINRIQRKAP